MIALLTASAFAASAPSPLPVQANGMMVDRLLEIDRRQRRVYRIGAATAGVGIGIEITGWLFESNNLKVIGGMLEFTGAPIMLYGSVRSGFALHGLEASPVPIVGLFGAGSFVVDAASTGAAYLPRFSQTTRRTFAWTAIGARSVSYVSAILQQVVNRGGRRRLDLRVAQHPRRLRWSIAPVARRDAFGLVVHLEGR